MKKHYGFIPILIAFLLLFVYKIPLSATKYDIPSHKMPIVYLFGFLLISGFTYIVAFEIIKEFFKKNKR